MVKPLFPLRAHTHELHEFDRFDLVR